MENTSEIIAYSRSDTERQFKLLNDELVELKCFETVYCNMNGIIDNPFSVDPDGGPYVEVGQILTFGNKRFIIKKIKSYNHDELESLLTVLFDVEKM